MFGLEKTKYVCGVEAGRRKKLKAESTRGPSAAPGCQSGLAASCTEGISKLEPPQWPKLSYEPDIEREKSFQKNCLVAWSLRSPQSGGGGAAGSAEGESRDWGSL